MTSRIYLFPDTNVFLRCKSLSQIDWRSCSHLAEFDDIHLIVCHPVMMEIDELKYRGNDSVGRRARKVYGVFRELVLGESAQRIIRPSGPTVTLSEATSVQPTPDLLDYAISDNRILGCAHAFGAKHLDNDVRFLTHDAGAMATAKNQGIPFVPVPERWRKEPQPSAAERENTKLKGEIERLRQTEPRFDIQFLGKDDEEIDRIAGQCVAVRSLTDSEVSKYIDMLRRQFPQSHTMEWLEDCEQVLRNLHTSIQHQSERLSVEIAVENRGTLPAKDALIELVGHGPILLGVPLDDDDPYRKYQQEPIELPSPPSPFDSGVFRSGIGGLISHHDLPPRDPNGFYFKPERPREPVSTIALECQQWRHEAEREFFAVEVYVDSDSSAIEGRLECRIHAENLSSPTRKSHASDQRSMDPGTRMS